MVEMIPFLLDRIDMGVHEIGEFAPAVACTLSEIFEIHAIGPFGKWGEGAGQGIRSA